MVRVLAVDWDQYEARCLLASVTGEKIQVLHAGAVPLVDVVEAGGKSQPDIGGSLRSAMADQKPGRVTVLVGVNRTSVELLNLTLPPAKDLELAQLVQNQAMRESQALDDKAALDYVPLSSDPRQPREVIAAVLSTRERARIDAIAAAAGVKPARILLRPFAAASLFARTVAPSRPAMLVNVVSDEADLTVVNEGSVVFLRTVRLPEGATEEVVAQRLSAEIARTLVVAQQGPLGGQSIEQLYAYGGPGEHSALADQLQSDQQRMLAVIDPFESADVSKVELPGNAGRFASLLGMALDESRRTHAVDFLHPRKPPRPPSPKRNLALIGALVGVAVFVGGYMYWEKVAEADKENRRIFEQVKQLDKKLKDAAPQKQLAQTIRDWKAGEVIWLDELRDLSVRMPSSRDVVVSRITMTSGRGDKGAIHLNGLVRDASVVARIDRSLRDAQHRVSSRRVGEQPKAEDYAWTFDRSITILPKVEAPPTVQPKTKKTSKSSQVAKP
jgi:Tfp pilus assembly PilM family ATPase